MARAEFLTKVPAKAYCWHSVLLISPFHLTSLGHTHETFCLPASATKPCYIQLCPLQGIDIFSSVTFPVLDLKCSLPFPWLKLHQSLLQTCITCQIRHQAVTLVLLVQNHVLAMVYLKRK